MNWYTLPENLFVSNADNAVIITPLVEADFSVWSEGQESRVVAWVAASNFKAKPKQLCLIPATDGQLQEVVLGVKAYDDLWSYGGLAKQLPAGVYQFSTSLADKHCELASFAWGLGAYRFERYKQSDDSLATLSLRSCCDQSDLENRLQGSYLVRNLINTPTDDLGPSELAVVIEELASAHGADLQQIIGDSLLVKNYPAVHAVGRASDDAPRLFDLRWGNAGHPKVTLVGKGVCYDTGGLSLKPNDNMMLMKKDMGGAAHVLGLALMIMQAKLPIQLRVLIPAVENAVSGNAYRPGDIIATRAGKTVEIGNTDAEGRLILADALFEAASEKPELIVDVATLTGAARVAVGPDIAAMFTDNDELATQLAQASAATQDPVWRLPLFADYKDMLKSSVADMSNLAKSPFAGASVAGLFLQEFVDKDIPWVHFDIMAWNATERPGRPQGGEALGLRAIYQYLSERFK